MTADIGGRSPLRRTVLASVDRRMRRIRYRIRELPRMNPVWQSRIQATQDRLLREIFPADSQRLIVFMTPAFDRVNGGILSISSLYEETLKLKHIHQGDVILCTPPGQPTLLRYTRFANQNHIFRFSQILPYFRNLRSVIIHVPAALLPQFVKAISKKDRLLLSRVEESHINIMLQGTTHPRGPTPLANAINYSDTLRGLGRLTCSTAHERYTTPELRARLGYPLHKLSVWISPERYNRKAFAEKEELMIVSPDPHPKRGEVLSLIARRFPELQVMVVENLTYEEFKDVISRAKWAVTFGEGLDGYFLETIFSGGISFAVYNSEYFTEDFGRLRTVYADYDVLLQTICGDLKYLDNEKDYASYQQEQHDACARYYDHRQYVRNLELFYKGEYTYK